MTDKTTNTRVGFFVLGALVIGGAFIFALGSQSSLFSAQTTYRAVFEDVGGIRSGNAVQIAGVSVGSVDEVRFLADGQVEVLFNVNDDAAGHIRGPGTEGQGDEDDKEGSIVSLGSKGMLGDRLIDIVPGHPDLPAWDPETPLPVDSAPDLMGMVEDMGQKVDNVIDNVGELTETLGSEQLNRDLETTVGNLALFTGMLANPDGAFQRLLTNPETADRMDATLENVQATSSELRRTARAFRGIAEEVQRGDGSAHALIYGDEGRIAMANIGEASGEVAQILRDVRTGDGAVHDIIYEGDGEELMNNLTEASEDLAAITEGIREGRGTIGGLLVDPSIYEDVKRLVGDLERNDILRSLVRYSIRRDESVGDAPEVTTEDSP